MKKNNRMVKQARTAPVSAEDNTKEDRQGGKPMSGKKIELQNSSRIVSQAKSA